MQIYSIGSKEAAHAVPQLAEDAVALIQSDQAFGLSAAKECEARGAICAPLPRKTTVESFATAYFQTASDFVTHNRYIRLKINPVIRTHIYSGKLIFSIL